MPVYSERSQPLGKRFGRLKTDLGFDHRYVFHSIRKTAAHMFETEECPVGVARYDVRTYSGETRMDHRARWLAPAIRYPSVTDDRHPDSDQTENPEVVPEQAAAPTRIRSIATRDWAKTVNS